VRHVSTVTACMPCWYPSTLQGREQREEEGVPETIGRRWGRGRTTKSWGVNGGRGIGGGFRTVMFGGEVGAGFGAVGVGYSLRWKARAFMYGKEWN